MQMDFFNLKYDAFGLDINDTSVKIIKLEKKRDKFSIVSWFQLELKPGVIEMGAIKDKKALIGSIKSACASVNGKKLKTKYVILSLPEEESFMQVIQMPKMDDSELKSAIGFQAENYIPMSLDEVYLDFENITPKNSASEHLDVLVAAVPKKTVDSYISCVKASGLTPICAEIESLSLARTLINEVEKESSLALIDFGVDSAELIIFSNKAIRLTHSIPMSQNQVNQTISSALEISVNEAEKLKKAYGLEGENKKTEKAERVFKAIKTPFESLACQIKKYIDYYQEHLPEESSSASLNVKKIILTGGGADIKNLAEFLKKKVGINCEIGDVFVNLDNKNQKKINADFLPFATAIGLALNLENVEKQ